MKKKHNDRWFWTGVGIILLIATLLRFLRYWDRWGLAYDQAHDALVARYALENGKIPLLGPFSSAGPFQTGGQWYWLIMLFSSFNSNILLTPWIGVTFLYVLFVYFIIIVGSEIENRRFGLLVGLLSAVSTAQIAQSTNLTNQSPQAIVALVAIWAMVKFYKLPKLSYLVVLGLAVGTAISIHLQGAALIVFAGMVFFLGRPFRVKHILAIGAGLFLALLPLLLSDMTHDFVNTKNMAQYYLVDQYKISFDGLGRRWLTYVTVFWPNEWGHIIGGNKFIGGVTAVLSVGLFAVLAFKKGMTRTWVTIWVSLVGMAVLLRYIRTPIYSSYLVFLHPFILLVVGWLVYRIWKKYQIASLALLCIIVGGSLIKNWEEIRTAENFTAVQTQGWAQALTNRAPGEQFWVYDHVYKTAGKSLPLSLLLDTKKLIHESGRKVGVGIATVSGELEAPLLAGEELGYQVVDLSASTGAQLSDFGWIPVNPRDIYEATEEWYEREHATK